MSKKMTGSLLTVTLVALGLCLPGTSKQEKPEGGGGAPSLIGTWKLNEAKSKVAPGPTKNTTVVYESVGDAVKVTTDGITAEGKAFHEEWTGKYDGRDYPFSGNPNIDTLSYKWINGHTVEVIGKKGGKVIITAHVVIAADGKSRTVTTTQTTAEGKKMTSTGVYDKQ